MVNIATVGLRIQQLIITDTNPNRCYLVDTGAQVSVIPASYIDRRSGATTDHIQADFLRQHNLLVDLKEQRLIEGSTFSPIIFSVIIAAYYHLVLLDSTSNKFRKILGEFPDLLKPTFSSSTVPYGVQHYITTSGPPTHSRTRYLSTEAVYIAKTAIITTFGLYEYFRMPFGRKNVEKTFQRLIDTAFQNVHCVFVYLDDILIASLSVK